MKVSRILYLIAIIFSSFPLLAQEEEDIPFAMIKKYQYPEEALEKKIEGRVIVTLRIDKEGFLSIKEVKGRNPLLEEEAYRIFDGFPQLSPALLRGKPVNIVYNYPVIFRIIQ